MVGLLPVISQIVYKNKPQKCKKRRKNLQDTGSSWHDTSAGWDARSTSSGNTASWDNGWGWLQGDGRGDDSWHAGGDVGDRNAWRWLAWGNVGWVWWDLSWNTAGWDSWDTSASAGWDWDGEVASSRGDRLSRESGLAGGWLSWDSSWLRGRSWDNAGLNTGGRGRAAGNLWWAVGHSDVLGRVRSWDRDWLAGGGGRNWRNGSLASGAVGDLGAAGGDGDLLGRVDGGIALSSVALVFVAVVVAIALHGNSGTSEESSGSN